LETIAVQHATSTVGESARNLLRESAPALLNVGEIAHMLGVSQRTCRRMSDAGAMPAPLCLRGAVRWRRIEVESWIERGCPPVDGRGVQR